MTKQQSASQEPGTGLAIASMNLMGLLSAVIVGLSFYVIHSWPLPASVAPYMGFSGGFWWGLIVGGIAGLVIGFLVDEKHFN